MNRLQEAGGPRSEILAEVIAARGARSDAAETPHSVSSNPMRASSNRIPDTTRTTAMNNMNYIKPGNSITTNNSIQLNITEHSSSQVVPRGYVRGVNEEPMAEEADDDVVEIHVVQPMEDDDDIIVINESLDNRLDYRHENSAEGEGAEAEEIIHEHIDWSTEHESEDKRIRYRKNNSYWEPITITYVKREKLETTNTRLTIDVIDLTLANGSWHDNWNVLSGQQSWYCVECQSRMADKEENDWDDTPEVHIKCVKPRCRHSTRLRGTCAILCKPEHVEQLINNFQCTTKDINNLSVDIAMLNQMMSINSYFNLIRASDRQIIFPVIYTHKVKPYFLPQSKITEINEKRLELYNDAEMRVVRQGDLFDMVQAITVCDEVGKTIVTRRFRLPDNVVSQFINEVYVEKIDELVAARPDSEISAEHLAVLRLATPNRKPGNRTGIVIPGTRRKMLINDNVYLRYPYTG